MCERVLRAAGLRVLHERSPDQRRSRAQAGQRSSQQAGRYASWDIRCRDERCRHTNRRSSGGGNRDARRSEANGINTRTLGSGRGRVGGGRAGRSVLVYLHVTAAIASAASAATDASMPAVADPSAADFTTGAAA